MSIENFYVHPDRRGSARTDVDLLATRFKYREERYPSPRGSMIDDSEIADCPTFANIILAEITDQQFCKLNGPWTNPRDMNMERVLRSIGCVTENELAPAAQTLYRTGKWENPVAMVRLFAIGHRRSENLPSRSIPIAMDPNQQLTWSSVIDFCLDRFKRYRSIKTQVDHWAADGTHLKDLAETDDREGIYSLFGLGRR
jgi:hypothetical protein